MPKNGNLCFYQTYSKMYAKKMDLPTSKYLMDYLYVIRDDVPFIFYKKVSLFCG